jgi:UDP-N-acetylglucosamine 2-epimerase
MAPVVRELAKNPDHFGSRIFVTGKHREIFDQAHDLFAIRPGWIRRTANRACAQIK